MRYVTLELIIKFMHVYNRYAVGFLSTDMFISFIYLLVNSTATLQGSYFREVYDSMFSLKWNNIIRDSQDNDSY